MSRESALSSVHRPAGFRPAWGIRALAALALVIAWLVVIPAGLAHAEIDVGKAAASSADQVPMDDDGHGLSGEAVHCAAHCAGHSAATPLAILDAASADPVVAAYVVAPERRARGRSDEPPMRPPAV